MGDFYPRSPCGERRKSFLFCLSFFVFLSTLSLRRATHRPVNIQHPTAFLSTLSLRRATITSRKVFSIYSHFYPRSPCGERQHAYQLVLWVLRFLSTLSLRRATNQLTGPNWQISISIHALLAESDNRYGRPIDVQFVFLSTLSLRRATIVKRCQASDISNFYPRSPCGERLWPGLLARPFFIISIHALLAESDRVLEVTRNAHTDFYPRSPCGERHFTGSAWVPEFPISIHALLAESDNLPLRRFLSMSLFLSTLSLRRATPQGCCLLP